MKYLLLLLRGSYQHIFKFLGNNLSYNINAPGVPSYLSRCIRPLSGALHQPKTSRHTMHSTTNSQPLSCPESVHAAPSPEPRLAAIIPAYNEGLVIGSVVLQARKHADRVIVVDDGSSDRTAAIARLAGADVIEMPENGGKAKAMMAGFARARELGYEAVVMLDGDGQHDPEEIPAVAAPVLAGQADLVIGSRFLDIKADIPKYRVAGQKVLNGFTNLSTDGGFATTDSQSGFRALSRRALENLTFSSEGYSIESDMIAHFAPLGLAMTEVPISVTYDVPHKHKLNPVSHGFGVLARIVGLIGYRRPLLSFGIPGVLITLFGIGAEIYTFSEYYRTAQFHYIVFTGGFAALILGLLLLTSGLILNSLVMITKGSGPSKESIL